MFRGILSKATPILATTTLAATSFLAIPSLTVSAVDNENFNPNYFYDRETAFIINNAIDYGNGGMYLAVDIDGGRLEDPIPESVWGYEPGTIPGVYKSHIGQATCIRYLISEYQRTDVVGTDGINDLISDTGKLNTPAGLLEVAQYCADFVIEKMTILPADDNSEDLTVDRGVNEDTTVSSNTFTPDQGETQRPNMLYYWGVVGESGNGPYFDDVADNSANGVSRSESVIPWTLAELALAMKNAGFSEDKYMTYEDAAIDYWNWRKNTAIATDNYTGDNFDPASGRDFYYGSLGFTLAELTGDDEYLNGDGLNSDGTPNGAIPFLNEHLGTGEVPDLDFPATNPLQEGAYIAAYGRGVPFAKHDGDISDRDQWWDFGHSPAITNESGEYAIRSANDDFYSDEIMSEAFAHYRGRELMAGVQRSLWFYYTNGVNPNIYYANDNLTQENFGVATKEYWDAINDSLWDDTAGQAAWLEATGKNYKPCFSGGNDVPIGDWLAPQIGDKIHTINSDNSALVTVSDVNDPDTPYLSWSFAGSGVQTVEVDYTTDDGATWTTLETEFDGTNYTATIPAVDPGTTVYYYAKAQDNFNNWTAFPAGAEEWDNQGNSLGRNIDNAQLYNLSNPELVDFQGTADEFEGEEVENPEAVEEVVPQEEQGEPIPATPQQESEDVVDEPQPIQTQDNHDGGGIGEPEMLIRTGGLNL